MGVPFRNLGPQERRNLALSALLGFYAGLTLYTLVTEGPWVTVGGDFLAFWSAGYLANTEGYVRVYDPNLLGALQRAFVPPGEPYWVRPVFFLPVFILPFQAFALFDPWAGYIVWNVLNLAILVGYLRFLARQSDPMYPPKGLLLALLFSYPVFNSFLWGQVSVWLTLCVGELLRAFLKGRALRAGAWMTGLLLKPQTLPLLIPALLALGKLRVLGGVVLGSLLVLTLSILMLGGTTGVDRLLDLISLNAKPLGMTGIASVNMTNWRTFGLHLSNLTSPTVGWGIAGVGMALTVAAAGYLWVRARPMGEDALVIALLGTLAATGAFTWHSHIHTEMILLPPLVYLGARKALPQKVLDLWVFAPPGILFLTYLTGAVGRVTGLSLPMGYGAFVMGGSFLALNLYLLAWAAHRLRRTAVGVHDGG
ncbi:MAG: glycosyltransferase family 87 protein [Anaerolineae bacterium]